MKQHTLYYLFLIFSFLNFPEINAQLFQSEEVLEITFEYDLEEVLEDNGDDPKYHKANLSYTNAQNEAVDFQIKIKTRGHSRKKDFICSFPPLLVKFPKRNSIHKKSLFKKYRRLKLVTHCRAEEEHQQYLLKEYLVYKAYNLVSENSLQVRLFNITYVDKKGKVAPFSRKGFFIEDIDELAERLGLREVDTGDRAQFHYSGKHILHTSIFQYMIGNSDWGLNTGHNLKMIIKDGTKDPIAVPYDFDWSGLVNAPYATPHPSLELVNVRQRIYQGICPDKAELQNILDDFKKKKASILSLFSTSPYLQERNKRDVLRYLEGFYRFIEKKKRVKKAFFKNC